jgi:hypothetical protein
MNTNKYLKENFKETQSFLEKVFNRGIAYILGTNEYISTTSINSFRTYIL